MESTGVGTQRSSEKDRLRARFLRVRAKTEEICWPLREEDYVLSVTADTSPAKWHLGHTSWFFENFILGRFAGDYEEFHPEYHFLFNSYYRRLGPYLPKDKRSVISRPTTEEIYQYRHLVTEKVHELLLRDSRPDRRFLQVLELGIHHEEQHQELLLMDTKRNFFENPLRPVYRPAVLSSGELLDERWHAFPEGLSRIGVSRDRYEFAYDNEKDAHQIWLEGFELSMNLVSNDEFLAFIDEGGYDNPRLWLSDGWEMKEREGWRHPLYWEKEGQNWWTYTLGGMVPLDLSAPVVHVSYYEAQAFARWKRARLPTEGEWETAAREGPVSEGFLEDGIYQPECSRDPGESFSQIHGCVWEWTQSCYLPYPRYRPFGQGLEEYNGKFMCNQFVLRGGSCVTPRLHYRPTYRNFYYPHMRWQYSGIRLARDLHHGQH